MSRDISLRRLGADPFPSRHSAQLVERALPLRQWSCSGLRSCFLSVCDADCLPVGKLPEGSKWLWELKLDGYRAIAVKSAGKVRLYPRNSKPFDKKFAYIAEALRELPDETTGLSEPLR
jgi:hypothetical protein